MKILLTGVNSFVGNTLYPLLLEKKFEVVGISRHFGDLEDKSTYENLPGEFDIVIHLARCSIEATRLLFNFCKRSRVKKIIYTSSVSIYGDIELPEIDESAPIVNPSVYGISKYMGELLLKEMIEISSFSLRLPAVLGKGAIGHFLAQTLSYLEQKKEINISNPYNLFNNCVHVDNLSEFIITLIMYDLSGFNVANIGSSNPIPIQSCVEILCSNLETPVKINIIDSLKKSFIINTNRAEKFGFIPWPTEKAISEWIK